MRVSMPVRATAPPLLPGRPRAASRCLRLQCPFQQRTRKPASRLGPLRGRHFAALNRMRLPGEPAGKRAKGGAGTGMFHPRRSVRQTNGVKVPRQRREDRPPLSGFRRRYHPCLTDKHAPGVFCLCRRTLCASAHAISNMDAMTSYPLCRLSIKCLLPALGLRFLYPSLHA